MALSRKLLEGMSLTNEQVESIIEAHTETVDALKKERDGYKAKASEADELKKQIEEMGTGDDYKAKYEAEHEAFEDYKKSVDAEKENAERTRLYRELLKDAGIDSKRIETVMKVTDVSQLAINKDGTLRDADNLIEKVKEEWSDFIPVIEEKGTNPENPPANRAPKKTREEILSIKDTGERQAAIAESISNDEGIF